VSLHDAGPLGPGAPTPPIALGDGPVRNHFDVTPVPVPPALVDALRNVCGDVITDERLRAEASRDWWPLAMTWAADAEVGGLAGVVVQPRTTDEVAAVVHLCNDARVPLTAAGGRSGVCGASVPVFGGVVLDTGALAGIRSVDAESLVCEVGPGTYGDHLEDALRRQWGLTVGHWPQSVSLSTVGGWVACRGAGQLSNRYGKIEDMVVGLEVVLADGTVVRTGGNARAAVGPDLTQVFVGSEGTLGIITSVTLRLHPVPAAEARAAWGFATFGDGLEACRRILRRGATPAVLRLYDDIEADRSYQTGARHVLLVLDEGDPALVDATMAIVAEECAAAEPLEDNHVAHWLDHRNNVAALESLISRGLVVDTMEMTASWGRISELYRAVTSAIAAVPGTLVASAHQSHAYTDGACLYVTFAGKVDHDQRDRYYQAAWDAGTHAALELGASLSHHHGVGLNRSRFMDRALGDGLGILVGLKAALDPHGILNPGKLGLPSAFGVAPFGDTPTVG
jgi:alkyldihydroxyacetonephosphate synthase